MKSLDMLWLQELEQLELEASGQQAGLAPLL